MSVTHRVVSGPDGRPVLVKRATEPVAAARLTGEAAVLRALAHPGAVTVVAHRSGAGGTELHLAWVGPHTLATVTGLSVVTAADLVTQVADTVADLHRAGIAHRRLTADHVLLGPGGRAVLTGFAEAARSGSGADDTAGDVAALGALLTRLVAPHDGGPVVPSSRRARDRRSDGGRRAALLTLADRAQADDPVARPTAADLAASIRATLGAAPASPRAPRPEAPRGRRVVVVALAVGVVATLGAAVWLGSDEDEPEVRAVPTTTTVAPTSTSTTTTSTTTPPACPPVDGTSADVDGDGCPDPISIDGEEVTVGGTTWRAGRPGDVVVLGDWDCDGRATVASLRTGTGEVFVFDRWERALTVAATTSVAGATGLRAVDADGDGCPTLVADRPGREPLEVAA